MSDAKHVSRLLPCVPSEAPVNFPTSLHAVTLFSNAARDGDYVLAASANQPLPDNAGANVFLIQEGYKLQFAVELADALTQALGPAAADRETMLTYAVVDYRGVASPAVLGLRVSWTPTGDETVGQGLIVALEATRFANGCRCDVRTTASVLLMTGEKQECVTDDWRLGALLARGYFYARTAGAGLQAFGVDDEGYVQRVQVI